MSAELSPPAAASAATPTEFQPANGSAETKTQDAPASTPSATNGSASTPAQNGSAKSKPARRSEKKKQEADDDVNPVDFSGSVQTNNALPTAKTLRKLADLPVLDRTGASRPFRSLYAGADAPRRVLVIFVRHFFCGNCQEYLRALSQSITPAALAASAAAPTGIVVVGCGDPQLIDMYVEATGCPFPVYADPTRRLYSGLGMVRTLALGSRPAYMGKGILRSSWASVLQGLRQVSKGLALKSGDQKQVGGEFLFEPVGLGHDVTSTVNGGVKGANGVNGVNGAAAAKTNGDIGAATNGANGAHEEEEKRVTWCHRMRTTRDHAEIPELMEVLALDGHGQPAKDRKRWSMALETRKGTGLSLGSQMRASEDILRT